MYDFWARADMSGGPTACWPWRLVLDQDGYGRSYYARRRGLAHRTAYELAVGPIPDGLQIDHLCRNRACVNPSHMEPVTKYENQMRGLRGHRVVCLRGHQRSPDRVSKIGACKDCNLMFVRRARARRRERAA